MATWTEADMPDLTGRTAIVTGANSGLGFECAVALAAHGADVVMACRDTGRCEAAAARVLGAAPGARVESGVLDLADLESVRRFSEAFLASHDSLDILLNNAGVMSVPKRRTTAQGFELQLGTNHLGHFALTGRLLPIMLRTPASRVVTVSSLSHEGGRIDFDDLQLERGYVPYKAYGASKLANLLFMLELDRRLRRCGADVVSVGAHPGFASTHLQAAGPFLGSAPLSSWLILAAVRIFGQSAAGGARPLLYAATDPRIRGGDYIGPRFRIRGGPVPARMAPQALDEAAAARLWDVSEELTRVDIDEVLPSATGA